MPSAPTTKPWCGLQPPQCSRRTYQPGKGTGGNMGNSAATTPSSQLGVFFLAGGGLVPCSEAQNRKLTGFLFSVRSRITELKLSSTTRRSRQPIFVEAREALGGGRTKLLLSVARPIGSSRRTISGCGRPTTPQNDAAARSATLASKNCLRASRSRNRQRSGWVNASAPTTQSLPSAATRAGSKADRSLAAKGTRGCLAQQRPQHLEQA